MTRHPVRRATLPTSRGTTSGATRTRFRGALRGALSALTVAAALVAAPAAPAAAQLPSDAAVRDAYLAWYAGDYPAAVQGWLAALRGPGGDARVAEIAALTGESFETTRLDVDGSGVLVGPSGRYATWRTTGTDGAPVTRVAELPGGEVVADLPGVAVALSQSGRLAWYSVEPSPELAAAARAMEEARAAGDRSAFFRALAEARWLEARDRVLRVRDLATGDERVVELDGWIPGDAAYATGTEDLYLVVGRPDDGTRNDIVHVAPDGELSLVPTGPGFKDGPVPVPGTSLLVFEAPPARPLPTEPGVRASRPARTGVGVVDLITGREAFIAGAAGATVSADGSRIAWIGNRDGTATLESARLDIDVLTDHAGPPLVATEDEIAAPALSPDGRWVAYQRRPVDDWEIYAVRTDGLEGDGAAAGDRDGHQVTWEIQHDQFPVFVDTTTVMAMKGEGRHRRAFLYDVTAGGTATGLRLHHNNTLRTIAPEYEWVVTPDGSAVVVVAERDGDTVSPERGVWLVHLDRPVTRDALVARLEAALAAETALRDEGRLRFRSLDGRVRAVTDSVDVGRIYHHAKELYTYGSKYVTQPGNRRASAYLAAVLESYGYDVEVQWFEAGGHRTANVIARLPGTVDPDVVYVASSHYDSVERGPGADDDTSGTTALLEVARVLAGHPQAATIELAFFTGEEAGLLGSREYVRRAVATGKGIVGALNNDMVGWSDGPRLDNTIRYSNPGIRDVQHQAAILFSDLILYDALYYKNTDAHAYYEAYGDIVGGIGSYPVLGNPHYHQFTDRLNTVNHVLVGEVAKTTAATLVLLASSPSRVSGLTLEPVAGGARATWDALPESGVVAYEVTWTDADGRAQSVRVDGTSHTVRGVAPGSEVRVRGVDRNGAVSWDWARAVAAPAEAGS